MRVFLALVLLAVGAPPAAAGVEFHFRASRSGDPVVRFSGIGLLDGSDLRLDISEGNHPLFRSGISIITAEPSRLIAVFDNESKTYFRRSTLRMRGALSTFNAPGEVRARDIRVRVARMRGSEIIAAHPVRKLRLEVSYTIDMYLEGVGMKASVSAVAEFWCSDIDSGNAIPYGFHYGLKTGFDEVDSRVRRRLRTCRMPLREVITASRSIEGSPPVSETLSMEVESLTRRKIDSSEFEPEGFRYQEPSTNLLGITEK